MIVAFVIPCKIHFQIMHKMRISKKERIDTQVLLLLSLIVSRSLFVLLCIPSANLIPNLNSNPLHLYFQPLYNGVDFHPTNFYIKFEISLL